jgi:hypothetical protein
MIAPKSVHMDLPLDMDGLLALLERLDGAEEVAVVRSALEGGVPRERVMDELQREVERRLARLDEGTNLP